MADLLSYAFAELPFIPLSGGLKRLMDCDNQAWLQIV